ncbi:MAG TPA: lysophospholipid acyltransferase family protein [Spirochaetota bacterium]|nr:lysophospholipid acyltransferase family protein [Spirochaetota bacterium]
MNIFRYILTGIVTLIVSLISLVFILLDWWLLFIPLEKRYFVADKFLIIPWTVIVNNLLGIKVKFIGKENIDKKRATLYICNHQSWVDIPTFLRYSHAPTVAKKEVKNIPFLGILIIYAGVLFLDRKDKNGRLGIIKGTMKILKKGGSFCVFPEGTRSKTGELLEPNLTLVKICYKMNIPVVPTAIEGSRNILEKGNYYVSLFKNVILKYNSPIYPKDYQDEDTFAKACWDMVESSHNEIINMINK